MDLRVELEGCRCPGAPHPRDWVDIVPDITLPLGAAVLAASSRAGSNETVAQALLSEAYLLYGIGAWSFVDDVGDPIPVTPTTADWPATVARLLPFGDAYRIADRVSDVHPIGEMIRPLLVRSSTPSPDGPTATSTSATSPSGPTPRRRSAPSSPTSTDGQPSEVPAP